MTFKLGVMTGTRAEYGIFRPLLKAFQARGWRFELYVTGMHLEPRFGSTIREIEADGFSVAEQAPLGLVDDTPQTVSAAAGQALKAFSILLERRRPDLLFILGDRFEAFTVAAAAQICNVPVAHLHGGERTEGLVDEAFRHSITKMSRLHFVAAAPYAARVRQLGEEAQSVFTVGALGLDNLADVDWLDRQALEAQLGGFRFRDQNILVTHHPLTLDLGRSGEDFAAVLAALDQFPQAGIVITLPNADVGGSRIAADIEIFSRAAGERVKVVSSLGTQRYFSLLKQIDLVLGNSSSGLIEVPSFGKPTVNVGDRQKGRLAGPSVINVPAEAEAIVAAIRQALDPRFQELCRTSRNPYGDGASAQKICDIVAGLSFPISVRKPFIDIPTCASS